MEDVGSVLGCGGSKRRYGKRRVRCGKVSWGLGEIRESVLRFPINVPSRVGNLGKMRNFWAYFTDFEPEIIIIKCKTAKT